VDLRQTPTWPNSCSPSSAGGGSWASPMPLLNPLCAARAAVHPGRRRDVPAQAASR
jgi:hypothetical protein